MDQQDNTLQDPGPGRYESGKAKIDSGRCPIGASNVVACMFCTFGHMLECHHPLNCREANCEHWQARTAEEE